MFELFSGDPAAGAVRAASARPHQRLVLRDAEPRPRDHLRPAQHHQFRAWRAVHDGRVLRLVSAQLVSASAIGRRWSSRRSSSARSGSSIERLLLRRIYKLDHLYGLLLTFGLALVIEGLFRQQYGSSGQPYTIPAELRAAQSRLHVPADLPRLGHLRLARRLLRTWFVIERTRLGALSARRDREPGPGPGLRHQRAAHGDPDLRRRRRRSPRWPACWRRRSIRSAR